MLYECRQREHLRFTAVSVSYKRMNESPQRFAAAFAGSESADANSTRQRLIEVGRDLFANQGYRETSVREITREAGANLGAVTYHFGSKRELYEAVLVETARPLRDAMQALARSGRSALERIEGFVEGQYRFLANRPEFKRLVLRHLANDEPCPEPLARVLESHIANLRGLIVEGQESGEIREGNPSELAVCVASGPMWFNAVRTPLGQILDIDQESEEGQFGIGNALREWVRSGLRRST